MAVPVAPEQARGWTPRAGAAVAETKAVTAPMFDAKTSGYDAKTAYAMGQLAELSYEKPAAVEAALAKKGFTNFVHLDEGVDVGAKGVRMRDSQAFIASSPDAIVVSFRGTEGAMSDLFTDAAALIRVANGTKGGLHRGFVDAFSTLRQPMMNALIDEWNKDKAAGRPPRPVFMSGHSLGGAIATLAAQHVQENFSEWKRLGLPTAEIRGVYSFGSPKVGSPDFAKYYDQELGLADKTFRHVNNNDRVAQVPTGYAGLKKWEHVGQSQERFLTQEGKVKVGLRADDPARVADMKAGRAESRAGWWEAIKTLDFSTRGAKNLTDGINDHLIGNYLAVLKKAAGE